VYVRDVTLFHVGVNELDQTVFRHKPALFGHLEHLSVSNEHPHLFFARSAMEILDNFATHLYNQFLLKANAVACGVLAEDSRFATLFTRPKVR
jgi:hypothetical protein